MNLTENFIAAEQMNAVKAMNMLQNAGVISDNCQNPGDVADADFPRVRAFLCRFCTCALCGNPRSECYC